MASGNYGAVLRDLGRIFDGGSLVGLTDGQLLRRFAAGDEGAFDALVSRCGPTVLGVCRRLLHNPGDVEDAFQATFLVLLRKAGGLRDPEAIGPWLHGVAHRVAARIRVRSARRPEGERRGARPEAVEVESAGDVERDELRRLIEDEIGRLPEKYRRPVVLCYVEGRTHEEAARRLRCSAGSLRGRLDRARRRLQNRLARRGVAPAIGLGALSSLSEAAVPAPLVSATVATLSRAATASAAAGSINAIELANGVFRAMGIMRLKVAAAVMVMAGLVAAGAFPMLAAREPVQQDAGRNGASPLVRDGNVARGRVLDDQGRPIAGARVARGSDLRGVASVPEVVTDAEGRFVMRDIPPPGPIVLTAQAPGRAPDLRVINPGPEMSRVEFRLGPGHTIRGRIVDVHGKPIAGAPISADEWRGHHSLRWSTRTDADGRFRWDEAPADGLLIDLGQLGFDGKRFWTANPDRPERTFDMRRPLRVRGRVTDAATGRPITRFTLVPGSTWSGSEAAQWENNRAREITGLSYDVTLSTVMPARLVRIEAPGYLPAVSRVLKDDEEEAVVHFALRRGEGLTGVIRAPDGSPLAGVEVALATAQHPASIQSGRFLQDGVGQPRIVRTGADGRFALEPSKPPYTLIALHDRGFARRTVSDQTGPAPAEMTLEPWGRIEGTLKIGRQPGGEQTLSLECNDMSVLSNGINWSNFPTTDAGGRFTVDRLVPGKVHISRHISLGDVGTTGGNPSLVVDVRPGETTRVTVGGTGRAVVGKVKVPDGLAGRKDWTHGLGYLHPSQAGAGPGTTARSIVFKAEADGSFRIDDVAAGTYLLTLPTIKKPSDSPGGFFGTDWIAKATREVVVPSMPGDRSDEPLDLGTIQGELVEHPVAPKGVKRP